MRAGGDCTANTLRAPVARLSCAKNRARSAEAEAVTPIRVSAPSPSWAVRSIVSTASRPRR